MACLDFKPLGLGFRVEGFGLHTGDWYAVAACIFEESCVFSRVLTCSFIAAKGSSQIRAVTVH